MIILSAPRATIRLLVLLAISAFVAACSPSENKVTIHTAQGEFTFSVEIADTPEARRQGLMFRQELAPDAGMLFDFETERPASFWMQNTLIPLDIIFIAADGTVRNIAHGRPQDPTSLPSDGPVRFVLEIAGGRGAEIGLDAGDTIDHPRVERERSSSGRSY